MQLSLLRDAAFRAFLFSTTLERFASAALTVVLGVQVYNIAHNPLDLGWLGLAEAIPGVTLVLYGGHVADRRNRRLIMVAAAFSMSAVAIALAVASFAAPPPDTLRLVLFAAAFLSGTAHAFKSPAASAVEAQVVPADRVLAGVALLATTGRVADVVGPVAGGFALSGLSAGETYGIAAALFLASVSVLLTTRRALERRLRPVPVEPGATEGAGRRIAEGVRYVFRDQVLVGSMALDLFAVFFGGATALLPAVASDVLHVGPVGLGFLRAAMGAGSLTAALFAAKLIPLARAGVALHAVIGGFGVAMVVFGLSRSFALSFACLYVAGVCDGASVIVRRAILRFASPEAMRGRIAAVKSVFVGSSNELGALESGFAASWLGVMASIWAGGIVTLAVVGATALLAPKLLHLDLAAMAAGGGPAETPERALEDAEDEARDPDTARVTVSG